MTTIDLGNNVIIGTDVGSNVNPLESQRNVLIGYLTASNLAMSNTNVLIGGYVAQDMFNARDNTAIGQYAGKDVTDGSDNVLIGVGAGAGIHDSNYNVLVGKDAGREAKGSLNMFLGPFAGKYGKNLANTTLIGSKAGAYASNGGDSVFIGSHAGYQCLSGNVNICIGRNSGTMNHGGSHNVYLGDDTGYHNQVGSNNVLMGTRAGFHNRDSLNVMMGAFSGENHTYGGNNLYIGPSAGRNNSNGSSDVFIGSQAGENTLFTTNTVSIGYKAAANHRNGRDNVMLGSHTGSNVVGSQNIIVGYNAAYFANGNNNIVMGNSTAQNLQGDHNVVVSGQRSNVSLAQSSILIGNVSARDTRYVLGCSTRRLVLDDVRHSIFIGDGTAFNVRDVFSFGQMPSTVTPINNNMYFSVPGKVVYQANDTMTYINTNMTVQGIITIPYNGLDYRRLSNRPTRLSDFVNDITNNGLFDNLIGNVVQYVQGNIAHIIANASNTVLWSKVLDKPDVIETLATGGGLVLESNGIQCLFGNSSEANFRPCLNIPTGNSKYERYGMELRDGYLTLYSQGNSPTDLTYSRGVALSVTYHDGDDLLYTQRNVLRVTGEGNVVIDGDVYMGFYGLSAASVQSSTLDVSSQANVAILNVSDGISMNGIDVLGPSGLNIAAFNGIIPVTQGGTGTTSFATSRVLLGNGFDALNTSDRLSFTEDNGLHVTNANISVTNGSISVPTLYANTIVIDGSALSSMIVPVSGGGTGRTTLANTCILIGNGANEVQATSNLTYANGTLNVVGLVQSSEGFVTSSDARLKSNVHVITNPMSKLEELHGYTYRLLQRERRDAGVIAQEVALALPEAVHTNTETGYQSVSYGGLTALLIECVKDLHDRLQRIEQAKKI